MAIGTSIFLLAFGAILAFAVTIDSTPLAGMTIEWDTVGVILMIVGAIGLLWSLAMMNAWRNRGTVAGEPVVRDTVVERDRFIER